MAFSFVAPGYLQPIAQVSQPQPVTFTFSGPLLPSLNISQTPLAQATTTPVSIDVVEQPWVNTRFSDKDSDVQIRSADGFVFRLHRAVLEMNTGTFPGPEVPTEGEPVPLTENANVLAILFSFVYPKRHPDLDSLNFQTVAAVAEAAGKYEVFAAMNTCNTRLTKFFPHHALDIFVHSVKHDYPKLMNEAVPHLCLTPLVPVLKRLPPLYMIAWSQYHEAWRSVFKEATKHIKSLPIASLFITDVRDVCDSGGKGICNTCRCALFTLISDLEAIEDISTLDKALEFPALRYPSLACCGHGSTAAIKPACKHPYNISKLCREKIRGIPAFSTFLSRKD